MSFRMALRRGRLEAWPVLEPPLVFAWGSRTSAVSPPPVQTSVPQYTRAFLSTLLFEKSLHRVFFFSIFLLSRSLNYSYLIDVTVFWYPHLLFLPPLLLRIHAGSTYLSVMCLWEHSYAFPKSIFWSLSGSARKGIWAHQSKCRPYPCLINIALSKRSPLQRTPYIIRIIAIECRCTRKPRTVKTQYMTHFAGQREGLEAVRREERGKSAELRREKRE